MTDRICNASLMTTHTASIQNVAGMALILNADSHVSSAVGPSALLLPLPMFHSRTGKFGLSLYGRHISTLLRWRLQAYVSVPRQRYQDGSGLPATQCPVVFKQAAEYVRAWTPFALMHFSVYLPNQVCCKVVCYKACFS